MQASLARIKTLEDQIRAAEAGRAFSEKKSIERDNDQSAAFEAMRTRVSGIGNNQIHLEAGQNKQELRLGRVEQRTSQPTNSNGAQKTGDTQPAPSYPGGYEAEQDAIAAREANRLRIQREADARALYRRCVRNEGQLENEVLATRQLKAMMFLADKRPKNREGRNAYTDQLAEVLVWEAKLRLTPTEQVPVAVPMTKAAEDAAIEVARLACMAKLAKQFGANSKYANILDGIHQRKLDSDLEANKTAATIATLNTLAASPANAEEVPA